MENNNSSESSIINNIIFLINDYLSGRKYNLYEKLSSLDLNIDLDLKHKFPTEFSLKVVEYIVKNVKYGETTSYSEIGRGINSKAYRAIGNVLKKNPVPLIIPCHRVIKKNREIGGFMGHTDNDWQQKLKKGLLEIEKSKPNFKN